MARYSEWPRGIAEKQQAAQAARVDADIKEADDRRGLAPKPAQDETSRVRGLQRALAITRFDGTPGASTLFSIRRSLIGGIEKCDAETDLIGIERFLSSGSTGKTKHREPDLRARLARRKAELKITDDPPAPRGELPPEVQRALDALAEDEAVLNPHDPAANPAANLVLFLPWISGRGERRTLARYAPR